MRLTELKACFLRLDSSDPKSMWRDATLADAHGIILLCPVCFAKNGGSAGTHSVICWFRHCGVPDDLDPKPGRWTPQGTGLDDLTFVAGEPPMACSVLLTGPGCGAHFFIKNGGIE
jgi:hypothetical protein